MTPGDIELLVAPTRAAARTGLTEYELAVLRRRNAGPRWRRYLGGALYSTADLDRWRDAQAEPRWAKAA